jgi:ribosomal protein L16 Arg81 hydroxylase
MTTLKNLLKGHDDDDFYKNYWTKKVLHKKGTSSDFDEILNWSDFNSIINYRDLSPHIRFSLNGKLLTPRDISSKQTRNNTWDIDEEKMSELIQHDATIIIETIHKLHPNLYNLISNLSDEFGETINVNAYCSSAGKRGFDKHTDAHEVFVLQIEGTKEWEIFDIENIFPVENQLNSSIEDKEYPSKVYTLEKGDLFYVPRGTWHRAFAKDEASLHLTIGIKCRTGLSVMNRLFSELKDDIHLRKNLNSSPVNEPFTGYKEEDVLEVLQKLNRITCDYINKVNTFTSQYNAYCSSGNRSKKIEYSFPTRKES